MLKNHKIPRFFIKTLKFLKITNYKFKSYIILNLVKFIPQTLLSRLIWYLIIILFLILLGLIIFVYNQHWRKIRETLIRGVANNIYYTSILINSNYVPTNLIPNVIYNTFDKFNIINNPSPNYLESYIKSPPKLSKNARILALVLKKNLPYQYYIKEDNANNIIIIVLLSSKEWCEFFINKNAFFIDSLISIVWYTFLLYLGLILTSYIFFKLLLKPLKKLSENVILFGKGQDVVRLVPKGTLEIKNTIGAFNDMKERINRYIEQRTLLLSSISHDLKSTLTKMSLTLELAETTEITKDLQKEISNMNHMLSNYLTFARNEFQEEALSKINIRTFFNKIIKPYKLKTNKKIKVKFYNIVKEIIVKPLTLNRALTNIIDNSITHGDTIVITIKNTKNNYLKIIIDDDGPGINPKNYKDVFKPFYRLNKARTLENNVGLGLSIVKDAINKHGGNIILAKSPLKGLRVIILVPY